MARDYLSFEDVLSALQIEEQALRRMVSDSEIRAYREGDRMVFSADDVARLRRKTRDEGEELYTSGSPAPESRIVLADFTDELKSYFARHPEKLHALTPRRFEELVAAILTDFGFDVELTRQTRDGGRDLYAWFRNQITSFLVFVECKKWQPSRGVGIDVVQRLHGVTQVHGANKGMIVTTSFFTTPARQEAARVQTLMELRDYDDLKSWLERYRDHPDAAAS